MFLPLISLLPLVQLTAASPLLPRNSSHPLRDGEAKGSRGAAVSEVSVCSELGVGILKKGGNAADAAITTSLCVGVTASYHSGIGGGGFMLVRYPKAHYSSTGQITSWSHEYTSFDFRETMPALGNETMYLNSTIPKPSTVGGLAVGVPGEMRGWEKLHGRFGKLSWKEIVTPVVELARGGFKVHVDLANALNANTYPFLLNDTLWAESFAPNGTLLKEGDTCYRHRLADTLERIANNGPSYFYHSSIAENIVYAAGNRSGIIQLSDLQSYTAIERSPAQISYRGHKVTSTIAPSSGTVVLSALKIFEGFEPKKLGWNESTHRIIEADRWGYAQRTEYGDPAFTKNVSWLEKQSLTPAVYEAARVRIDNTSHPAVYYNPDNNVVLDDHGTSHIATVDDSGLAVTLTTTVNLYWGSQVMTDDGIILNDEMDDFSSPGQTNAFGYAASPANYIRPGKRPQSSISASMVEDLQTGTLQYITGAAGGSRIITANLEHISQFVDWGKDAWESAHEPRWHDQLGNVTYVEWKTPRIAGFNNATVEFLKGRGHNISYTDDQGSTSHVITRDWDGTFTAVADPRKAAGRGAAY
ncbi:gamma-glutamyltranspeptidase [Atractiella rhizophila]|nr:gamma-glutamyltranspeptidase [Atractiella rhizophila]